MPNDHINILQTADRVCYLPADYSFLVSYSYNGYYAQTGEMTWTPEYNRLWLWAGLTVFVYNFIVPLMFFVRLYTLREFLKADRSTKKTNACAFLHDPYYPQYWYWELIEIMRKVLLVGVPVVFDSGSLIQLVYGLQVCITVIALEVQVRPFRFAADAYCSLFSSIATIVILLMCICLKCASVADELESSGEVEESIYEDIKFDVMTIAGFLFVSTILVFAAVIYFAIQNIRHSKSLPQVRLTQIPARQRRLRPRCRHVHGTGAEQMHPPLPTSHHR